MPYRTEKDTPPKANDPLLCVKEAADILCIAPGTLRNWLTMRKIGYVKVGTRTIRIPLSVVMAKRNEQIVPELPKKPADAIRMLKGERKRA